MAKSHRRKNRIRELNPHNNSVLGTEHRIKNNTEYRTSVQKLLCYNNNKENSEKKQTQKQFFTVTVRDKSRENPKTPNNNSI